MTALPACRCAAPKAGYDIWCDERNVGVDETSGRYGVVNVWRCAHCRQLWLHYRVEYEAFSRSGRWARCPISEELAATLEPEQAVAVLDAAPQHIYGGSYWDTTGMIGHGRLHWGL